MQHEKVYYYFHGLTFSYQPVSENRSKICGPNPSQQFACAKHKAMVLQSREVGTISRAIWLAGNSVSLVLPVSIPSKMEGLFLNDATRAERQIIVFDLARIS